MQHFAGAPQAGYTTRNRRAVFPPSGWLRELGVGHAPDRRALQRCGFCVGGGITAGLRHGGQLSARRRFQIRIVSIGRVAHGAGRNQRHTTRRIFRRDIGDRHRVTHHGRRVGVEPERATGNRRGPARREVQRGGSACARRCRDLHASRGRESGRRRRIRGHDDLRGGQHIAAGQHHARYAPFVHGERVHADIGAHRTCR